MERIKEVARQQGVKSNQSQSLQQTARPAGETPASASPGSSATVVSFSANVRESSVSSKVRDFDQAKQLADSIADRVRGDEHSGLSNETVKKAFDIS